MKYKSSLEGLSNNFQDEEAALLTIGINSWEKINSLSPKAIDDLTRTSRATLKNLNRIKLIALFVCKLRLSPSEAALLMHSGVASIKALANSTPQEIIYRTGLLKRQLNLYSNNCLDLNTANNWIKRAQSIRHIKN